MKYPLILCLLSTICLASTQGTHYPKKWERLLLLGGYGGNLAGDELLFQVHSLNSTNIGLGVGVQLVNKKNVPKELADHSIFQALVSIDILSSGNDLLLSTGLAAEKYDVYEEEQEAIQAHWGDCVYCDTREKIPKIGVSVPLQLHFQANADIPIALTTGAYLRPKNSLAHLTITLPFTYWIGD